MEEREMTVRDNQSIENSQTFTGQEKDSEEGLQTESQTKTTDSAIVGDLAKVDAEGGPSESMGGASSPRKPQMDADNNQNGGDDQENKEMKRIVHVLQYAAAALSLISFLTTSNGLAAILEKASKWQAYLISFGIQAIVLGVGMKIAPILGSLWSKKVSQDDKTRFSGHFKRFISVTICALYIASISFSSFFSYVFLANHAYIRLAESDYNIEIDEFLVTKTKELKDTNDAVGKVLQREIQKNASTATNLLAQAQAANEKQNTDTQKKYPVTLNTTDTIRDEVLFGFEDIDGTNLNDNMRSRLDQAEKSMQDFVSQYEQRYQSYKQYYDRVLIIDNRDQIENISNGLEKLQNQIQTLISNVNGYQENAGNYSARIANSKTIITSHCEELIASVEELEIACEGIRSDATLDLDSIILSDVYKTIYSPQAVSLKSVQKARYMLQALIARYIDIKADAIDGSSEESLLKLSNCVTYLGEFEKYKTLDSMISEFETKRLNRVYLMHERETGSEFAESEKSSASLEDESSTQIEESSTESTNTKTITELYAETVTEPITEYQDNQEIWFVDLDIEEWKLERRKDLAQFSRLVKTLPDIDLLIQVIDDKGSIRGIESKREFVSRTLSATYYLTRSDLERINEVEAARNFLKSDYPFMACFCLLIAIFMDIASCFVGLFIYYSNEKMNDKEMKDKDSKRQTTKDDKQ